MDYTNELILTRKDLIREARELPLDEVRYYHIAKSIEPFKRARFVKLVDDNGKELILKDCDESKRI